MKYTTTVLAGVPCYLVPCAELDALRKDAEQLDAMCTKDWYIAWTREGEHCRVFRRGEHEEDAYPVCGWPTFFSTPREALAAAIAGEKK